MLINKLYNFIFKKYNTKSLSCFHKYKHIINKTQLTCKTIFRIYNCVYLVDKQFYMCIIYLDII